MNGSGGAPSPAAEAGPPKKPATGGRGTSIPRFVSGLEILAVVLLFAAFSGHLPLPGGTKVRIAAGALLSAVLVFSGWLHDDPPARMGFARPRALVLRHAAALLCWTAVLLAVTSALSGFAGLSEVPEPRSALLQERLARLPVIAVLAPCVDTLFRYPLLAAISAFAVFAVVANRLLDIAGSAAASAVGAGILLGFVFARSLPAALLFGGIGLVAGALFCRSPSLLPSFAALWAAMAGAHYLWPGAWHRGFHF